MKEINITIKNIRQKQWVNFLIELNLMKSAWQKFGLNIEIKARNFDRIIKWGKRKHGESENHEEAIHESEGD
jgi:hypothetical protein